MAMDKNPRYFVLVVQEVEVEANQSQGHDMVEIEFAGRITPTAKERLGKALAEGNFALSEKKLLG
jgi:hypothetical protein